LNGIINLGFDLLFRNYIDDKYVTLATADLSYNKYRTVISAENVIQVELKPTTVTY